jgi:taurine dioxygenase
MGSLAESVAFARDFGFDVQPSEGLTGAEIRGLRLGDAVGPEALEVIHTLLLTHKVLFFRDQFLSDAAFETLASALGDAPGGPEGLTAGQGADGAWRTYGTFAAAYPAYSVLRAVPAAGQAGDTAWANTVLAYESLPGELRDIADKLWAVHCSDEGAARAEHPLVRVHPDTAEGTMVLGHFARRFVGVDVAESRRLFTVFQDHITRPEHTVRWTWQAGDVAIWDNRATQHALMGGAARQMRHVRVAGDIPVGVDGRQSTPHAAPGAVWSHGAF